MDTRVTKWPGSRTTSMSSKAPLVFVLLIKKTEKLLVILLRQNKRLLSIVVQNRGTTMLFFVLKNNKKGKIPFCFHIQLGWVGDTVVVELSFCISCDDCCWNGRQLGRCLIAAVKNASPSLCGRILSRQPLVLHRWRRKDSWFRVSLSFSGLDSVWSTSSSSVESAV